MIHATSDGEPTRFQINILEDLPDGTILIGKDRITLKTNSQLHICKEESGRLKAREGSPDNFKFQELVSGNFAKSDDGTVEYLSEPEWNVPLRNWELVRVVAPGQYEKTSESSRGIADSKPRSQVEAEREIQYLKDQLEFMKDNELDQQKSLMQERAATKLTLEGLCIALSRSEEDIAYLTEELHKAKSNAERLDARVKSLMQESVNKGLGSERGDERSESHSDAQRRRAEIRARGHAEIYPATHAIVDHFARRR